MTDTTEFVILSSGNLYLAVILGLFSRYVVGWAISAVNDRHLAIRHLAIRALDEALKGRCPTARSWGAGDWPPGPNIGYGMRVHSPNSSYTGVSRPACLWAAPERESA